MNVQNKPLELSLLLLRLSVFLVMFMWTIDKFINPAHAIKVYEKFYFIAGLESTIMYLIGVIEMIILFMFLLGIKKLFSYSAILVFHTVSTLSSFAKYLTPFEQYHLLFFTAWPMLAACVALVLITRTRCKMDSRLKG